MFSGNLRGARLERFKFAIYLIAPIIAVYTFSVPAVHEFIFSNRRYIVYKENAKPGGAPPAAAALPPPPPPSAQ